LPNLICGLLKHSAKSLKLGWSGVENEIPDIVRQTSATRRSRIQISALNAPGGALALKAIRFKIRSGRGGGGHHQTQVSRD
jgi:hypothetical protein